MRRPGWPRRGSCCVFDFLIVARIGAAGGWSGAGGRLSVFAACASNLGVFVASEGIRKPTRTGSAGTKLILSIHLVAALFSALFGLFLFGCACRWLAGEIFMLPCVCYDCVPVACTFETL